MTKIPFEDIPHYVQIETSYGCNARCVFCYNPKRNQPPNFTVMRQIVDRVALANIPHVQLTGGEVSILPTNFINEMVEALCDVSTVSIQTNGIRYIDGLTKKLAIVYVSLHGTKKYHDELQSGKEWDTIVTNIKRYIAEGFEVNLDFTLTAKNYANFEAIAHLADRWGVRQYSINKFQPAGFGVLRYKDLVPTSTHFRDVITQIIRLQKSIKLKIGFCTAIPFCLDERLPKYGLLASCGAGTYLLAISPDGEVRICNQSFSSYGNILKRDLLHIWRDKKIDEFRNKSWVTKPCSECFLFNSCLGGCKVDNTNSAKYCVDYAIRGLEKSPIDKKVWTKNMQEYVKKQLKALHDIKLSSTATVIRDTFTKLNSHHKEKLLVTRHQTIKLNKNSFTLVRYLVEKETSIKELFLFAEKNNFDIRDVKELINKLLNIGAFKAKEYVTTVRN